MRGPRTGALATGRAARRPPELLSRPAFRLLLAAQLVAQGADGIAQAAFAGAILLDPSAQGTPGRILAVFALTLLPYSVIAPLLGVFVDRWDRRLLLVGTSCARAVLLVSLPAWAAALPGDAALYAALLLLLGLGRLFLTTKAAVLPVVLEEHHLLRGNALSGGGGMIAALLGGVLGLGAVALAPTEVVFVAAGVLYAASALISRGLTLRHAAPEPHESIGRAAGRVARELVEGVAEVWRRRPARLSLAGTFILRTTVMLTAVAAILVIKEQYPGAGDRFGRLSAGALALGVSSAGAFVGAVCAGSFGRRLGNARLILFGFLVSSIGIASLGGVVDLRAVLGLTAAGGFGAYVAKIATDAQVQEALPDELRGRAFALYDILYNLASVCAAGIAVATAGAPLRLVLTGAACVTLALAAALGRAMRRAGMW